MTTTRRDFLAAAAATSALATISPAALADLLRPKRNLKLLILGGTGFLGPHIVRRAIARGHEMTLFNRGQTGPDKFPGLEWLQGDRYGDLKSLEEAVAADRKWDAVIDTFTYVPKTVTDAMDVLLPAMNHYTVVSTVSVYAEPYEPGMTEDAPLNTVDDATAESIKTHREVGAHYGAMKARCEKAAEQRFPGRVANIRPGLIVGPGDWTGRYSYWPIRATEGGDMIAPGDGSDYIQVIDARDLADFIIRAIERDLTGPYTAISPAGEWTTKDMIDTAIDAANEVDGIATRPVWIPADFLAESGINAWQHMPAWVPNSAPGYAGQGLMSTTKAMSAGLDCRHLRHTAKDTILDTRKRIADTRAERGDEFADQAATRLRGGLDPAREREVLELWNNRPTP